MGRRSYGVLRELVRHEIHPVWALLTVGVLLILVLTEVALLAATLNQESRSTATEASGEERPPARAPISGSLTRAGETWRLVIHGEPGSTWLVVEPDGRVTRLHVGEDGAAELRGTSARTEFELSLVDPTSPSLVVRASQLSADKAEPGPLPTVKPSPPPPVRPTPAMVTARSEQAASSPPAPRRGPSSAPPILHLLPDAGARIALTFDGGMSSNGTLEFLDFLNRSGLEVTLFLTGQFIEREPGLARRVALAGHEVGNHSFSHPHLTSYAADRTHRLLPEINERTFKEELQRTELAFFKATGRRMAPLWRAPYGEENRSLRGWALDIGYLHVRWSSLRGASLDSRDWVADEHSSMYEEPRTMMKRLLSFPHLEGGIVLMHLSSDRIDPPWTELPLFLSTLRERGIEPVTVSELLRASNTWAPWLSKAEERHRAAWGTTPNSGQE